MVGIGPRGLDWCRSHAVRRPGLAHTDRWEAGLVSSAPTHSRAVGIGTRFLASHDAVIPGRYRELLLPPVSMYAFSSGFVTP